jgi:predicted DNA-binding transcriptional regulator AlpA
LTNQLNPIHVPINLPQLISDDEIAEVLVMTTDWIRAHALEIPGFLRLGTYYRFRHSDVERWLGSLNQLLEAEQVASLLNVPTSWVYANADDIPGVLRLGRYVRFRPAVIHNFVGGSEVVQ